jgi:hypothetical protein
MRIVLTILLSLIVLIVLVFLVGLALPRTHRAASRITLTRPPAAVWPVVRDLGSLRGVWPELKSAKRVADANGQEVWEQNASGMMSMRLIVEEAVEPKRMVTRMDVAPDAAFGGTWTYELAPSDAGTELTVSEDGYVSNPLFRVVMHAMGVHHSVDGYLRAVGTKLGETVTPEHVK